MNKKIRYVLNKILENKNDGLKVEFLSKVLKSLIINNKELYLKITKEYDIDELNEALKEGSKSYTKRLNKVLTKEMIYFLLLILVIYITHRSININIDENLKVLISMSIALIYIIFRSGKIKKIVTNASDKDFNEKLDEKFRGEIYDRINKENWE